MPGRQTEESYDLLFTDPSAPDDPIGVMLVRDPKRPTVLDELFEATEVGSVSPPRPVPVIWDDHRGGAGVAKKIEGVRGAFKLARNAATRFGKIVTPAGGQHELDISAHGTNRIIGFAEFARQVIVLTGDSRPLRIENGVGGVSVAAELQSGSTAQDAATFRGALYVACGTKDLAKFDGTTWTQPSTGQLGRGRLATVTWTRGGVPRRRLVATNASGTAFLYTTGDDPLNPAHWSSEVPIESAWPVQRLVANPKHVYATGPGGVFDLTENGETPCITGETWAKAYDPSAGASAVLYDGKLVVATGSGTFALGLDGQLVDVMEDISIGGLQPAEIPVGGRPRALFVVDGWLAQVTSTGLTGKSQLWYAKRRERTGAPTPWPMIWHGSEWDLDSFDAEAACVVSPTSAPRRIYVGGNQPARLLYQTIPRYGSPIQDYLFGATADRMDYARDWDVTETAEDMGDPASMKDPLWWSVLGQYLGGANRLTVSAAGRNGAFVEQGIATTDDARFGATSVRDKSLTVKVTGANSETVPAVLEAVKGSWVVTVEEGATVTLPVMFGQGVSLLRGGEDTQDGRLTFARLNRLTERTSVEAVRWNGERLRVRVEQGIRRRWQEDARGEGWVDGAVLTITVLARPMRHDVGDYHDIGLRLDG